MSSRIAGDVIEAVAVVVVAGSLAFMVGQLRKRRRRFTRSLGHC